MSCLVAWYGEGRVGCLVRLVRGALGALGAGALGAGGGGGRRLLDIPW